MPESCRMQNLTDICRRTEISFQQNAVMKEYTTFKIGGPAKLMVMPESVEQLAAFLHETQGFPLAFVGRGSNLLVSDEGYDGTVVLFGKNLSRIMIEGETVICEAGASLCRLCTEAMRASLTGLEFAYGIPGSLGGAVYMNAGAYGGEIKDRIIWAEHLDRAGNLVRVPAGELGLSYRRSRYTGSGDCIVRAAFRLEQGNQEKIRSRMTELMNARTSKQPLEYPSAGSTFKRPEGAYASALIEQCGLKGYRMGNAMISDKHSGFLINCGGASCQEVLSLIEKVQRVVLEKTGYFLEPEVQRLGK